jgi:hypothetical protein
VPCFAFSTASSTSFLTACKHSHILKHVASPVYVCVAQFQLDSQVSLTLIKRRLAQVPASQLPMGVYETCQVPRCTHLNSLVSTYSTSWKRHTV